MKLNVALRLVAVWSGIAAIASAQPDRSAPSSPSQAPSSAPSAQAPLTFAEAQQLLANAKKYVAHPAGSEVPGKVTEPEVVTTVYRMDDPPPAPPAENKPAAPGPDLVWVDGHYMPVENEWRLVMGAWAVPATPISVWIPGRYNQREKKWFPGYWEPDRPPMTPAEASTSEKPDAPPATAPAGSRGETSRAKK